MNPPLIGPPLLLAINITIYGAGLLLQLALVLTVGTLFYRLACWLFNRITNTMSPAQFYEQAEKKLPARRGAKSERTRELFRKYEMSAGSHRLGIPVPGWLKSLTIAFVANLLTLTAGGVLTSFAWLSGAGSGVSAAAVNLVTLFLTVAASVVLMSIMTRNTLPTTPLRGFIVAVIYHILWLMLVALLAGAVVMGMMAVGVELPAP